MVLVASSVIEGIVRDGLGQQISVGKVSTVQRLWQGYGEIMRVSLKNSPLPPEDDKHANKAASSSVIIKYVAPPRGVGHAGVGDIGHQRKVRSYEVESAFYQHFAKQLGSAVRVPRCLFVTNQDQKTGKNEPSSEGQICFVLEDLDAAGFAGREHYLTADTVRPMISWLARFHRSFLFDSTTQEGADGGDPVTAKMSKKNKKMRSLLWSCGCYWHLDMRPDELAQLRRDDPLRMNAATWDAQLKGARWQTLVHGDAKVENFCFSSLKTRKGKHDKNTRSTTSNDGHGGGEQQLASDVAAVDFQYVGFGVGVRDLAYCLSSCLSEREMMKYADELLDFYFGEFFNFDAGVGEGVLQFGEKGTEGDRSDVEREWRQLWPVCFADFERFLAGWCPGGGWARNGYTLQMTQKAIQLASENYSLIYVSQGERSRFHA
ncbi:unnamed protein product [Amoebophrya sp. A25]|nr:unnamed protein product [Amoebophrya sp. A25]|eukprot:GSA25T00025284001.1